MKELLFVFFAACSLSAFAAETSRYGLVIHGGAGSPSRADEAEYRAGLDAALEAGYAVLESGGSSVDAVVAAITTMENAAIFNAGHGAVLNADGFCELDAAIMDGRTRAAGAVAGLQHIRNPIQLAREVMEHSPHVMLVGAGAERFADERSCEKVPNSYFQTPRRKEQLERDRRREQSAAADPAAAKPKWGTVGCVALDLAGNLAAGTSTGGISNKKFGRVGDSPIIGAGTYAANATCAVSATGHGEYFIRTVAAHDVAARIAYGKVPLAEAAAATIEELGALGGRGGVIAINRAGEIATPFNTAGMCRAWRLSTGERVVKIYGPGDHPESNPTPP